MTASLRAHERHGCLRKPKGSKEVRFELRPDLTFADLFYKAEVRIARVIHHYVQTPEVSMGIFEGADGRGVVGYIQLQRQKSRTVAFGEVM